MKFVYNDGGRIAAGYKGIARDCVVRSIALATEQPYQVVYDALWAANRIQKIIHRNGSPRNANTSQLTALIYLTHH